jgi:DNA-binding IclR family transcriptional regulator
VLHGREVLYVVEQRAPGRPPLVTDVGVRLPAQLTASGKAMLADLPGPHVRALFPTRARSSTGTGPGRAGSPTCAGCCRRSAGAATPPRTAG